MEHLSSTAMLDYHSEAIRKLVAERRWHELSAEKRIGAVYGFVQNEILFGYNRSDLITASDVLKDGCGQCNTKATLLMALLRAVEIPCRLHGTEVDKHFQRGVTTALISRFAPAAVVHSWVEVLYEGEWLAMEGVIVDRRYLSAIQKRNPNAGHFSAYAISTETLSEKYSGWRGESTFIQHRAVVRDFGCFESPDAFFAQHPQTWGKVRNFLYVHFGRKVMNHRAAKIRAQQNG